MQRLLRAGELTTDQLARAEQSWRDRLRHGVVMPNGETVRIELTDVYHVLNDGRIRRRPERIERLLSSVFEIRQARGDRRRALGQWEEEGQPVFGFAIIESDSRLRTMRVTIAKSLVPYQRRELLLWQTS